MTRGLVEARLESDDQHAQQRAYAGTQHAASKTESAASARKEAVAGQQDGAGDHGNPGVDPDIYTEELEDDQDNGGYQGGCKDGPRFSERLFQCVFVSPDHFVVN